VLKFRTILVTQGLHNWSLPLVLFAKAPKSKIQDIAKMLGGLDCSKSYLLDSAKSRLVSNHLSL